MIYKVFFHDDIDGIVSAAIFVKHVVKNKQYQLFPVSSSMYGKIDELVECEVGEGSFIAVLDFENSKHSNFWADHHFNKKMGDKPIFTDTIVYDPLAKSCVRMLCGHFKDSISHPISFVDDVDMIDTAEYPSVDYIFNNTKPIMALKTFLESTKRDDHFICRMVELLASTCFDFKTAATRLRIGPEWVERSKTAALKIKEQMLVHGGVSIVVQKKQNQYPRYSEYHVLPKIQYAVRFSPIDAERMKLQIGFNPWCGKKPTVNVGTMCSEIDGVRSGGGHYNVGGGVINKNDIDKVMMEIIERINGMEKYGVDKNDPIEKEASEMVKTGEAANIDDARLQSVKKGESGKGEPNVELRSAVDTGEAG